MLASMLLLLASVVAHYDMWPYQSFDWGWQFLSLFTRFTTDYWFFVGAKIGAVGAVGGALVAYAYDSTIGRFISWIRIG